MCARSFLPLLAVALSFASAAHAATRCQITFGVCANYPSLSHQVVYDAFAHADTDAAACMVRAGDYYQWCGSSDVTTATFYANNTPVDSRRAGQPASCPAGWVCPSTPIYTSKIGMWYEIWWEPIASTPGNGWAISRYQPLLGYYDSGDAQVVQTHFAQMKSAGVDFLIFDDTNGITANDLKVDANVRAIMARDAQLPASIQIPYAFAIGAQLWANCSLDLQRAEADYVYSFSDSPLYFKWRGEPLLVNYNAYDGPDACAPNWDDEPLHRFSVRRATGLVDVGDAGLAPYGGLGWWGWAVRYPQPATQEEIAVSPGADNVHRGCPGCAIRIDRENGKLFGLQWLNAIKRNPAAIVVAGWNEFNDETAIEPARATTGPAWVDAYGEETPDLYLQIARGYGNLRTGLMDGAYYQDEDGLSVYAVVGGRLVYQSSFPHRAPVILLPAGTLRGLLGPNAFAPHPANGTLLTAAGLPPSVVVDGVQVLFQSQAVAQLFATSSQSLSAEDYLLIPSAGQVLLAAPVYGTSGFPPAFLSDRWELMPTDCLAAIGANQSTISSIPAARYGSYTNRATLRCR